MPAPRLSGHVPRPRRRHDDRARPRVRAGLLPNLAALWRRSATGTLRSSEPMVTPVAWTSFATGCTPPVHGIHEFYYVETADRTIRAEPRGAGARADALAGPQRRGPRGRQPEPADDLPAAPASAGWSSPAPTRRAWTGRSPSAPTSAPRSSAEGPRLHPQDRLEDAGPGRSTSCGRRPSGTGPIFRAQAEAAERADARTDWSALMVHFHNLDSLQHRLWPYLDVDETGVREPGWNEEVESCLRALDESVGRLHGAGLEARRGGRSRSPTTGSARAGRW